MRRVVWCTALRRFLGTISDYGIFGIKELSPRIVSTHREYALPRFHDVQFSFVHANVHDCNYASKTRIPRLEYSEKTRKVRLAFDLYYVLC